MATADNPTANFSPDQFLETIALHGGTTPDPTTGAMLTPIYQTTTYRQPAVGEHKGYTYSRSGNPTVTALEGRLAAVEGAEFATAYVTGLAATTGPVPGPAQSRRQSRVVTGGLRRHGAAVKTSAGTVRRRIRIH